MALNIAFLGCNEEQTRYYFREFVRINLDQIKLFNFRSGCNVVELLDGTRIRRISASSDRYSLAGMRFDQIIFACDRRGVGAWPHNSLRVLDNLSISLTHQVPDAYRFLTYDLDSEVDIP